MRMRNLLAVILTLFLAGLTFAQSAKIKGRVMDATGSIMPGVQVKVYQGDNVVQQGLSSDMGDFELTVNPGEYKLEVTAPDFNTYTEMVKVTPDLGPLAITMQLATVAQNVEVTETRNEISIDSDSSLSATVLKQDFIDALPDDEDELTDYLTQIAGARGSAGGGAAFIVDGFTGGRIPPKDQIQEIRISNNPFSAEFSGIGYGRTEIITKAGTGDFHGSAFFNFRDAALNARNPFLDTKPPAQMRNYESNFSGPIIRNKLSLNLNLRHLYNENTNNISAFLVGPDGNPYQYSAPYTSSNGNKNMNARSQYAINKNNTLYFVYQNQHRANWHQLGGPTNLQDRASDTYLRNSEINVRETAVLSKAVVHEFRFEYRKDYSQTTPQIPGQTVVVLDAFTSGSAQNLSLTNNRTLEFSNMLMYSGSKWTVKSGFQAFNHMNHSSLQNNYGGTYTFSSLATYISNQPLQFTQTSGNPLLDVQQLELAGYIQTDYKMTKKLNLSLGARYEAQTNLGYYKGLDPRIGFAYELTKTTALRGGVGIFHLRLDEPIVESLLRLDGTRQTQIIIPTPSYQPGCELTNSCDPLLGGNGSILPAPPSTLRTRSANLVTPYTENSQLSLEKTLPKGLGLTFSWIYQRGEHLYRSRNINAPLPGSGLLPDPTKSVVYQLEASGLSKANNFSIGWQEQTRNRFNLNIFGNYTLGFQNNDTDGWQSTPMNNYDMRSEWGRSGNDYRHRVQTGINFRLPLQFTMQSFVNWTSSNPYTITTGNDNNGDKVINDRPTDTQLCAFLAGRPFSGLNCAATTGAVLARNTGAGAGLFNMNFNVQKTIRLRRGESSGSNRAGNNGAGRGNNLVPPQNFPGGSGNFPGGGFPGGGGNFPGGQRGNGGNNPGGFNQSTTGPTMTFRLNAQNLLNNVQYNGFIGTMTSPYFAAANSARNSRQIEAQVRFNF